MNTGGYKELPYNNALNSISLIMKYLKEIIEAIGAIL